MSKDDDAPRPELAEVDVGPPPTSAGGAPALWSTLKHLARDSGVLRGSRALLAMNQPDGFDCPGCAWPEPSASDRSRLEFCENGAKAVAEEATRARATPELFAAASVDDLRALSDFELGQLGRITHPLVLEGRHYRPIEWDAAFELIARQLRAAGPTRSAFYTSGRTSNEAAFLYQLMGRLFGTNNFPDCSNMCHESSGVALGEVIGAGKGTVSLADFEVADLILVIGQNPGTNHPRMLSTLREAARRGATIVAINPLREAGLVRFAHPQKPLDLVRAVPLATHFVQLPIGGDQALFLGIAKAMLEAGRIDATFVAERTTGFEAWRAHVEATTWDAILVRSGVDEPTIRQLAELVGGARAAIACWAMGLTQHKHAVATIQEIVNVMLLGGHVGRPGAGLCPVRGHSNVQGDRTMGITSRPRTAFLEGLRRELGFDPPRTIGVETVQAIHGMERGEITAFVALGGNFLSATPDTERVKTALSGCALTVGITTKLNRTHLYPGTTALILPCLGRTERDVHDGAEQFVTVEDSMSMVHRSRGVLPPASDALRSEVAIVCGIASKLVGEDRVAWASLAVDYDRIRDLIARVVPGFTDFNARVRSDDGFQLPNSGRDGSFAPIGGRAKFQISTPPDLSLPAGRLRMMTIRSHDQYNTTVYGLDDRYRGLRGERRVVFVNPLDAHELGLVERQVVDLVSEWDDGERVAERFIVVPYDLPRGNAATYFPEANVLVPLDSVADRSMTPTSKSVVIRIRERD